VPKLCARFVLTLKQTLYRKSSMGNHARYKQTVDGSINPRRVSFLLPQYWLAKSTRQPFKGKVLWNPRSSLFIIRLRAQSTYYMHVLSSLATITQHTGTRQHTYTGYRVNTSLCQIGCWLELLASNN